MGVEVKTSSGSVESVAAPSASPARVLVAINQPILVNMIDLALNHGEFVTRNVTDPSEARAVVASWEPDLAIIDMDFDHGRLLRSLRSPGPATQRLAVIALTSHCDLKTKLSAFDRGVDDILAVPFSPAELVARALAVMHRTDTRRVPLKPIISGGQLEIDLLRRTVRAGGAELHLTSLELSLLYLLAANRGRLVTRDEILDALWGADYVSESNVIDRHVRNLRAKLLDNPKQPRYIATVAGRGYRFIPPP